MKKLDRISIKKLKGEKMQNQELKRIVGGGSYNTCCGSGCESEYDGDTWIGCSTTGTSSFCCYG